MVLQKKKTHDQKFIHKQNIGDTLVNNYKGPLMALCSL